MYTCMIWHMALIDSDEMKSMPIATYTLSIQACHKRLLMNDQGIQGTIKLSPRSD